MTSRSGPAGEVSGQHKPCQGGLGVGGGPLGRTQGLGQLHTAQTTKKSQ